MQKKIFFVNIISLFISVSFLSIFGGLINIKRTYNRIEKEKRREDRQFTLYFCFVFRS